MFVIDIYIKKEVSESLENFFVFPKSLRKSGNFQNTDYHESKKCHNFHLKNVVIIISCSK